MLRPTLVALLLGLIIAAAGCQDAQPVANSSPAAAPVPALPGAPSSGVAPASGGAAVTPASPAAPTLAVGPVGAAATLTLAAVHDNVAGLTRKLGELLDSVQDEASAAAAAPQIQQVGLQLAEAMKQLNATVAALSLSGQDEQISAYYQQQVEQQVKKGKLPEDDVIGKLERVVNSPQGPLLRGEINGLLDGMLAAGTSGTRRGLQRAIEQKKLRR